MDGWSSRRMESIYAHMVMTEQRVAHMIKSEDVSDIQHTGGNVAGKFVLLACSQHSLRFAEPSECRMCLHWCLSLSVGL